MLDESEGWEPFAGGQTIGARGSENGVVLFDDEHPRGARITLERGTEVAPFAITCGVYGSMMHTRFFGGLEEASAQYAEMRVALSALLSALLESEDDLAAGADLCSAFVERFP